MFSVDNARGDLHQYFAAYSGDVSQQVAQVIAQHGEDADIVAAKRADGFLRAGDTMEGARWMKIFRAIAASHVARAQTSAGLDRSS